MPGAPRNTPPTPLTPREPKIMEKDDQMPTETTRPFDLITGPCRIRINPDFVTKASTLHECWIDYGHPIRLKRLQWAEDIDDAGREKLEQLLRVNSKRRNIENWKWNGIRQWLRVIDEYKAAREAAPQ